MLYRKFAVIEPDHSFYMYSDVQFVFVCTHCSKIVGGREDYLSCLLNGVCYGMELVHLL